MEHLVRFTTPERREGQHSSDSLEEALKFVERLRNAEGATDVRLFRMLEVPFEFKPYYRVELSAGDSVDAEPLPGSPAEARPVDDLPRPTADQPRPLVTADVRPLTGGNHADFPGPGAVEGGRRLFGR